MNELARTMARGRRVVLVALGLTSLVACGARDAPTELQRAEGEMTELEARRARGREGSAFCGAYLALCQRSGQLCQGATRYEGVCSDLLGRCQAQLAQYCNGAGNDSGARTSTADGMAGDGFTGPFTHDARRPRADGGVAADAPAGAPPRDAAVSCAAGKPCRSSDPCHVARVECATGVAVCTDQGAVVDGTACGANQVCGGGRCVALSTGGWADATNTGYKHAPGLSGSLSTFKGTIESGQTYRFFDFPQGLAIGSSSLHPTNVTFVGCRFASNAVGDANVAVYGDNITFDYCTFEPNRVSAPPTAYAQGYQYGIDQRYAGRVTVDHCDFWGWGNGIQLGWSSQAKPFVVRNSWFHDARDDGGGVDHTDA
jgi:hypothetical protein